MTEDRMPRLVIDAILIVRVVSNYQSAGAVCQKLRGKGKKGGLTAFLFPPLRLSFASLTLLLGYLAPPCSECASVPRYTQS